MGDIVKFSHLLVWLVALSILLGVTALHAQDASTPDGRASYIQGSFNALFTYMERGFAAQAEGDTAMASAMFRQARGRARSALTHTLTLREILASIPDLPDETPEPPPPDPTPEPEPEANGLAAFPGAYGAGSHAMESCRGLPVAVHKVGAGLSLKGAATTRTSNARYDFILFDRGGLEANGGEVRPPGDRNRCVYIAGQTAPGGGYTLSQTNLRLDRSGSDWVIRGLTFQKFNGYGLLLAEIDRAVLSDLSAMWSGISIGFGGGNILTVGQASANVTIQNNLLAEPAHGHPTVAHLDAQCGTYTRNVSTLGHRHPLTSRSGCGVEITQNIVHNWCDSGTGLGATGLVDIEGNRYTYGPCSETNTYKGYPIGFRDQCTATSGACNPSLYVAHNVGPRFTTGNQWGGVICDFGGSNCTLGQALPTRFQRTIALRLDAAVTAPRGLMSDAVHEDMLTNAGASWRITCDGSRQYRRSAIDAGIIAEIRAGTGPTAPTDLTGARSPTQSPVVPIPAPGTPCPDQDGDGLPDAFEVRYGGNATSMQAGAMTPSGYLVIEHYVNGTTP